MTCKSQSTNGKDEYVFKEIVDFIILDCCPIVFFISHPFLLFSVLLFCLLVLFGLTIMLKYCVHIAWNIQIIGFLCYRVPT